MTIDIAYGIIDDVDIQQLEEHLNDDTACQIMPQHATQPWYHKGPGETWAVISCPVCNTSGGGIVCGRWVEVVIAAGRCRCNGKEHYVPIASIRFVAI